MAGERASFVIVGGGITGLSLARELAHLGHDNVVVIERRYTGAGGSSRNITRIRAMQLRPEIARLAIAAQRKHKNLRFELGVNTLYWETGYAWVSYDDFEVEFLRESKRILNELGMAPELLGTRETLRRMPILRGGERPAGMLFHAPDASAHHDAVLYGVRSACQSAGIEILENTEVTRITTAAGRVGGVIAGGREIRTPVVVNAAGGWSAHVSALAGLLIPNRPVRREALVTESARPFMKPVVTFYRPTEGWFHQTQRGELIAGVVTDSEPLGLNLDSSPGFISRVAGTLRAKAPRLGHLRVVRQWAGVYDVTPDRMPLVGPSEELPGFVQANGYSGRGFALGPLVGELLASWLHTGRRPEPLAPCDPDRFRGMEDLEIVMGDYYAGYALRAS